MPHWHRVVTRAYLTLHLLFWSLCAGASVGEQAAAEPTPSQAKRPNIVFILADDLGFTDIAPYGSEVSTPNLSALAQQGIRFTNYHTAANCAPAPMALPCTAAITGTGNSLMAVIIAVHCANRPS